MKWLSLFLVPVSVLVAQQKASLQGHVVDASGRPIERVKLALLSENPPPILCCINDINGPHTQSDANGGFRFDSVQPGRYRLVADKSGYALQAYGGKDDWREGTFLDLSAGAVMDIVFPLVAAGTISGVLLDENGDLVAGKRVLASRLIHDVSGHVVRDAIAEGTTDIQGHFTIPKLAPGTYILPGDAQPIRVGTGEVSSGHTARIVAAPVRANVRGRIEGAFPSSAHISMGPRGQCAAMAPFGFGGPIASDGSFEIRGVSTGAYTMCVSAPFESMRYAWTEIDVGPHGVDDLVLRLEPRFNVSGQVTIEGQPAPGLSVTLRPLAFPSAWRSSATSLDGAFRLTEVEAVPYELVMASMPVGTYVASVRLRDREVAGPVDFSGGDPGQPLVIALKRSSSELRGTAPVGSIITLIPEPERPNQIDLSLTTTTDTTGLFVFKSAAPGMYRITAWDELERNAHLDPEFMARYRDKGTLIAVDENVNQTVTLPAH